MQPRMYGEQEKGSLWQDVCIFMLALMLLWSSGAKSKGKTFLLLCILVNTLLSPHAVFMCSQPHKQTAFNSAVFSSPVVAVITVVSVCAPGFSMKTEGFRGHCALCVAWFEGVTGWVGLFSVMKYSGCKEHYTHIKPSLADFLTS